MNEVTRILSNVNASPTKEPLIARGDSAGRRRPRLQRHRHGPTDANAT
jgi:hypothetical protein